MRGFDWAWVAHNVRVGERVKIGPYCVIGHDGFGYAKDHEGRWAAKPQSHGVVIGDDVTIHAGAIVARGSYRDTVIGRGTKIDSGAFIAHNCLVGEDCIIVANAELSGSVVVGDGAWIGPNACVREHLTIGEGAVVGNGAVVVKDVAPGTTVVGNPARPLFEGRANL